MENKNIDQETTRVYKGKLFDVAGTNQQFSDPQRIRRLTNPEYQEQISQEAMKWMFERYGKTFEQLKYL